VLLVLGHEVRPVEQSPAQVAQGDVAVLQRGQSGAQPRPGAPRAAAPGVEAGAPLGLLEVAVGALDLAAEGAGPVEPAVGGCPRPAGPQLLRQALDELGQPGGQPADRLLRRLDMQRRRDEQVDAETDRRSDQGLVHPADSGAGGPAESQDDHRADRHFEQVLPQPEQLPDDQCGQHHRPQAPPGEPG